MNEYVPILFGGNISSILHTTVHSTITGIKSRINYELEDKSQPSGNHFRHYFNSKKHQRIIEKIFDVKLTAG